jgi:hypothetical protein
MQVSIQFGAGRPRSLAGEREMTMKRLLACLTAVSLLASPLAGTSAQAQMRGGFGGGHMGGFGGHSMGMGRGGFGMGHPMMGQHFGGGPRFGGFQGRSHFVGARPFAPRFAHSFPRHHRNHFVNFAPFAALPFIGAYGASSYYNDGCLVDEI